MKLYLTLLLLAFSCGATKIHALSSPRERGCMLFSLQNLREFLKAALQELKKPNAYKEVNLCVSLGIVACAICFFLFLLRSAFYIIATALYNLPQGFSQKRKRRWSEEELSKKVPADASVPLLKRGKEISS